MFGNVNARRALMTLPGGQQDNSLENLRYGTHGDNQLDQVSDGTHAKASATHCPKGHPYDEANTLWYRGVRHCKICKFGQATAWKKANPEKARAVAREATRRYRARRREAVKRANQ